MKMWDYTFNCCKWHITDLFLIDVFVLFIFNNYERFIITAAWGDF